MAAGKAMATPEHRSTDQGSHMPASILNSLGTHSNPVGHMSRAKAITQMHTSRSTGHNSPLIASLSSTVQQRCRNRQQLGIQLYMDRSFRAALLLAPLTGLVLLRHMISLRNNPLWQILTGTETALFMFCL